MTELERKLILLFEELLDMEGPQPGNITWYRKVRATLDAIEPGPSHLISNEEE